MRLDKYLAEMGVGSRSYVKELIRKGRVCVDGQVVKTPEYKITQEKVSVDGEEVGFVSLEYYLLYKPAGYLTACSDAKNPVVMDLIQSTRKDLAPVGRLDKDTEGVLLITNDGALAHRLLSPKNHIDKVYYAEVEGILPENAEAVFSKPIEFKDFTSSPAGYEKVDEHSAYLTIYEGKYHQVKRMFGYLGCPVTYLKRVRFGNLTLENMKVGQFRPLTPQEIQELKKL